MSEILILWPAGMIITFLAFISEDVKTCGNIQQLMPQSAADAIISAAFLALLWPALAVVLIRKKFR